MSVSEWAINSAAKRVVRLLSKKPFPDYRLRGTNISGQMQELYLNYFHHEGKKLTVQELEKIWKTRFQKMHTIFVIQKEIDATTRQLKKLNEKLKDARARLKELTN